MQLKELVQTLGFQIVDKTVNLGCANGWRENGPQYKIYDILKTFKRKESCQNLGNCYNKYSIEVDGLTFFYTVDSSG
jgi:hypothetical protein